MAQIEDQKKRLEQCNHGVNKDGTVDGHVVETYLAVIYALHFPDQYNYALDFENKFVAFCIDNGGTDLEVRLPFELVASMKKWIDDGPHDPTAPGAAQR
jgi:hypothetical protein